MHFSQLSITSGNSFLLLCTLAEHRGHPHAQVYIQALRTYAKSLAYKAISEMIMLLSPILATIPAALGWDPCSANKSMYLLRPTHSPRAACGWYTFLGLFASAPILREPGRSSWSAIMEFFVKKPYHTSLWGVYQRRPSGLRGETHAVHDSIPASLASKARNLLPIGSKQRDSLMVLGRLLGMIFEPRPSNYPPSNCKYHQVRTTRFQLRAVGGSRKVALFRVDSLVFRNTVGNKHSHSEHCICAFLVEPFLLCFYYNSAK